SVNLPGQDLCKVYIMAAEYVAAEEPIKVLNLKAINQDFFGYCNLKMLKQIGRGMSGK
ncbi:hypothetical protein ElyMa_005598600, partial [Elysia marginata]